jgi:hypothetical protein
VWPTRASPTAASTPQLDTAASRCGWTGWGSFGTSWCLNVKTEERDEKEDMAGEEDKNLRVFLHTCMTTEGVRTQVAQLNKFEVLDFDFASSWT